MTPQNTDSLLKHLNDSLNTVKIVNAVNDSKVDWKFIIGVVALLSPYFLYLISQGVSKWRSKKRYKSLMRFIKLWTDKNLKLTKGFVDLFSHYSKSIYEGKEITIITYPVDLKRIMELDNKELHNVFIATRKSYAITKEYPEEGEETKSLIHDNDNDVFNYMNAIKAINDTIIMYNDEKDSINKKLEELKSNNNDFIKGCMFFENDKLKQINDNVRFANSNPIEAIWASEVIGNFFPAYNEIRERQGIEFDEVLKKGNQYLIFKLYEKYMFERSELFRNNEHGDNQLLSELRQIVNNTYLTLHESNMERIKWANHFAITGKLLNKELMKAQECFERLYNSKEKWFLFYPD